MTTFAQRHGPSYRLERGHITPPPKKYDIRAVDQFYAYCQSVSRTAKHRDEAQARSHAATKRSIWTALISGSFLFYYLAERVVQAMAM